MDKLVREIETGSSMKGFRKICVCAVRELRSSEQEIGIQERLDQTMYLGAVMLAKACWVFDDGSKNWDDHLSLDYRFFSCESLDQSECLWLGCSLRLSWIARRLLDDLE
ncbi:hypothetical protein F2Q69_00024388 [Brassica cretica]|uniref:Uncharacterized protein n=1 Tax=Brassica cretica TaxID=69181 RepID=A0A8S9QDG7_BRACR|nr:hypothetical protein F2Q69_00024388 [Brassica cretica]